MKQASCSRTPYKNVGCPPIGQAAVGRLVVRHRAVGAAFAGRLQDEGLWIEELS